MIDDTKTVADNVYLLPEKQRLVVSLRLMGKSQQEVADELHLSKERIRQLEKKAWTNIGKIVHWCSDKPHVEVTYTSQLVRQG